MLSKNGKRRSTGKGEMEIGKKENKLGNKVNDSIGSQSSLFIFGLFV